jgi:ATP-dependent protease ClpP protease subunit
MAKPIEERNYKLDHKLNLKVEDLPNNLHQFDVDLKSNHIYLFSVDRGYEVHPEDEEPGIDWVIANRFIKNFNLCMRVNPNKPILVHMKTRGGAWEEGMAIYDTIRSCPWPVTILNYTHARSMSSIIFQAANKRVMMPNSQFMFHQGTEVAYGTVKQVHSYIDFYKKTNDLMLDIYTRRMKESAEFKEKTDKQIKHWLTTQMDKKEDVFLTATETVNYGLADYIFDYNWKDLTIYSKDQMER